MQIRLLSMELNNFKNVQYGKLCMPSSARRESVGIGADILGIYGQNGSGKTAVTDMLSHLKLLLSGESLPPSIEDYITQSEQSATIICSFSAKSADDEYTAEYRYTFSRTGRYTLSGEKLAVYRDGKKQRITSVEYSEDTGYVFYPRKRWQLKGDDAIEAEVQKRLALSEGKSCIFSEAMYDCTFCRDGITADIISSLREFAESSLYIIRPDSYTKEDALIEFVLPRDADSKKCEIYLTRPTVLPSADYKAFLHVLDGMNKVMNIIIPGFNIALHEFGREVLPDGRDGMRFELMTGSGGISVPIRYESEGIKKIISVINLLIGLYNNYQMCVVIDELDAGVFEFLLGELLSCIEESGRGQLIFTSHNLRPLEMIDNAALIFTTVNPMNRYIRITEKTRNLRSTYLRYITLGGPREDVYVPVNTPAIAHAFRSCRGEDTDD